MSAHDLTLSDRRDDVTAAALSLSAAIWNNRRESAAPVMDVDDASDRLDDALNAYVAAATSTEAPVSASPTGTTDQTEGP